MQQEFRVSDKPLILAQFKDPVSHMCLAGPVVAQEVAGSSPLTVMTGADPGGARGPGPPP